MGDGHFELVGYFVPPGTGNFVGAMLGTSVGALVAGVGSMVGGGSVGASVGASVTQQPIIPWTGSGQHSSVAAHSSKLAAFN